MAAVGRWGWGAGSARGARRVPRPAPTRARGRPSRAHALLRFSRCRIQRPPRVAHCRSIAPQRNPACGRCQQRTASACMHTDGAARRSAHLGFLDIEQIQCSYPELTCVFWVGSICGLRPFRFDVRARRRSGACAWRLRPPAAALGGKHCGAIFLERFFFGILGVGCCPPFLERVLRARRGRKKMEHA